MAYTHSLGDRDSSPSCSTRGAPCLQLAPVLHLALNPRLLLPAPSPALQLRLGEKRILRGTMDGVRRRLAPIRGIPTKVRTGSGVLLHRP